MAKNNSLFDGLRRMIFTDEPAITPKAEPPSPQPPSPTAAPPPTPAYIPPPPPPSQVSGTAPADPDVRQRVYSLLEKLNRPGIDFFEVWNAAVENGGATASNLRSAFKALRFADSALSKEKVLESGRYYTGEMEKVLEADRQKKERERLQLADQKQRETETLSAELKSLDEKIMQLQTDRQQKGEALQNIHSKWDPQIQTLNDRLKTGGEAVQKVIDEMKAVLAVAEREL